MQLASVGKEEFNKENCRWLEIISEVRLPNSDKKVKTIFKGLIPEKHLRNGQSPSTLWVKGWMKVGDQAAQPVPKELLVNPKMTINFTLAVPPEKLKATETRTIDSKLGKLVCNGVTWDTTLKESDTNSAFDIAPSGAKIRVQHFFHEKSPFGLTIAKFAIEPKSGAASEQEITLSSTGTNAKSELEETKSTK